MVKKARKKPARKRRTMGVVGLGYVGLPLARTFFDSGFNVTGFDVDPNKVKTLNGGKSYTEWPVINPVRNLAGETILKEATADMITHIKWQLNHSLDPGATKKLTFRVVVN